MLKTRFCRMMSVLVSLVLMVGLVPVLPTAPVAVAAEDSPVTKITGIHKNIIAGTPYWLDGMIHPLTSYNMINRTIIWEVLDAGTTGATINGAMLSATATGTMTIQATVPNGIANGINFTQDFSITVLPAPDPIVPDGTTYLQAFPDANFREIVLDEIIGDGRVESDEISEADILVMSEWEGFEVWDVSDMTGLKYFTGLLFLVCDWNQLTSLDVSNNIMLEVLVCNDNQLTTLDVSNNPMLDYLACSNNNLTELDVSNNLSLMGLDCDGNQLTELDLSKNTMLWSLTCFDNNLKTLDVSNNPDLGWLACFDNDMGDNPDSSIPFWMQNDVFELVENKDDFYALLSIPKQDRQGIDGFWGYFWYFPQRGHSGSLMSGIDYDGVVDVIVPGTGASGFSINLTQETITIPDTYSVVAFSIDGGAKWKPVKDALSAAKFPKLFNKDLTLHLSDKAIDKTTKKPAEDAQIVTFAKIEKRPKAPALVVNYAIGADASGETYGDWLLTEKNGTTAVKKDVLVGVASGKTVDSNGYGQFLDGAKNGIALTEAKKTTYFIKTAPKPGTTYTAASKTRKINVSGAIKAPTFKVTAKPEKKNADGTVKTPATAIIKVKKNTYIKLGDGEPRLYTDKASIDVLSFTGTIELWTAATAKKPPSKKQTITR